MKNFGRFWIAATFWSATVCLHAQTNDWQVVHRIAPGTSLSGRTFDHPQGRRECELVKVTDADLRCEAQRGPFHRELVFRQNQIREIRLEHPEHYRLITGATIGGVAGAVLGALAAGQSDNPETRRAAPAFGASPRPIDRSRRWSSHSSARADSLLARASDLPKRQQMECGVYRFRN